MSLEILIVFVFVLSGEGYQQTRQSNNSLASAGSSQSSSPPESPYGSQYLDQNRQGMDYAVSYFIFIPEQYVYIQ